MKFDISKQNDSSKDSSILTVPSGRQLGGRALEFAKLQELYQIYLTKPQNISQMQNDTFKDIKLQLQHLKALMRKRTASSTTKRNRTYSQNNKNYTLYASATRNKKQCAATKNQESLQQDTYNYDIQQGI